MVVREKKELYGKSGPKFVPREEWTEGRPRREVDRRSCQERTKVKMEVTDDKPRKYYMKRVQRKVRRSGVLRSDDETRKER